MNPLASPALVHACFRPTYASARAAFLQAADAAGARTDVLVNDRARAPDGSTLTTDVAIVGPDDAENALLIVSGTHGPEGFAGSAAQVALLNRLALEGVGPDSRVVLVHAINPFGFAHLSRTTEHNVDLNRNFIDWTRTPPGNPHYTELHPTLCLPGWNPQALDQADAALDAWVRQHGQAAFVDVLAKGQYAHPEGLYYGGAGREWSNEALEQIVTRHLAGVRRLGLIDWHTGLGERGQPFFLCFNARGGAGWQRACAWWGRENVESTGGFDGASRPDYSGLLFHGVQAFAAQAELVGAVVELGTTPSREMRHALQMDQFLRFAGLPAAQLARLQEELMEAFVPHSLHWQRSVLGHAIAIQAQALLGVRTWQ